MAKPQFTRPKSEETGDSIRQLNIAVSIDMKNWVTFTARSLGKTNSQFVREILEWAQEVYAQEDNDTH